MREDPPSSTPPLPARRRRRRVVDPAFSSGIFERIRDLDAGWGPAYHPHAPRVCRSTSEPGDRDRVNARVLVMGAGSGAANNLIASLRSVLPGLVAVGAHGDPFILKKSVAARNYLLSPARGVEELARIVDREDLHLVIPSNDAEVKLLSDCRAALAGRLFLPPAAVIDRCQDKCELAAFLGRCGVPVPVSFPLPTLDALDEIFEQLARPPRLWCRMRSGSGSLGAAPVTTASQARAWIEHWASARRADPASFMI